VTRRVRLGLLVLTLSFAGLGTCWAVANPIGSAPDEPAHYIKALAVGQGEWLGTPVTAGEQAVFGRAVQAALNQLPLATRLTRRVTIPADLEPDNAGCTAFNPAPATCAYLPGAPGAQWGHGPTAYTYLGTYQPFVYVLPGIAMHAATTPLRAFLIGRLTFGAIALVLIAAGGFLCFEIAPRRSVLVGLLAGLTPMVVFTSVTVSASSTEIAAGVAVFGAVLHLAYGGTRKRLAWMTLALGGATLAVSRTLGPLWVVIILLAGVGVMGWRPVWHMVRQNKRWCVPTATVLTLACAAGLAWQIAIQPRPALSLHALGLAFLHGFDGISTVLQQEIGVFGWLDTNQVGPSYVIWGAIVWSLVTLALFTGSRRERWTLGLLVAANLLLTPILYAVIAAPAGGGVQGRWLLPVAAGVPLLAGVVIARNARITDRATHLLTLGVVATIAVVQFLAFYQDGRRYAVGPTGALLYFRNSLWSPPGGWVLWLGLALVSCVGIVAAAALIAGDGRPDLTDGVAA
jgi:Predicted membrane protein (DUF2142)